MKKCSFLARHGIVRNAIKEDLLFFVLPTIVVFGLGVGISSSDGYEGLVFITRNLLSNPGSLHLLSLHNMVGLALIGIGFTILLVAHHTIRWFHASTLVIRENHQLITHGIYSFTRHPIYLGALTGCIGIPVYAASLVGLLAMLILIPIFLNRIRMEERLLIEEFGDAYQVYKQTTRKLIPFIY